MLQDESHIYALMRSVYGYSLADCDEMTDAAFHGYAQNLDNVEERKAQHIAAALLPLLPGFAVR